MDSGLSPQTTHSASAFEIAAVWGRHLTSFSLPLVTFGYVVTGPHVWWAAILWFLPLVALDGIDAVGPTTRVEPRAKLPAWPFDGALCALAALQLANVFLFCRMMAAGSFLSIDTLVGIQLLAATSGFSGIVVAHELIHRPHRAARGLGRLLLVTVLYEHFYTEHLRGHHVRVGTREDPATARFGETYLAFLRRTIPGQFRSAWRLETRRLGDGDMGFWDRRIVASRVVHGLTLEVAVSLAIFAVLGPAALAGFVLQAIGAVSALEAVNYFEHWGLERRGRRVRAVDSWDTDSAFTYYGLVGLSRHADHHRHASRPYQELVFEPEAPLLPAGYLGMVRIVQFENRRCRALLTAELERKRLGPFAPDSQVVAS